MATLPERLRELRKQKKLTQKDIAEKLKIKQNSYSDWENGKSEPNIEKIIDLAMELDSTIDYLLGNVDINLENLSDEDIENIQKLSPDEIDTIRIANTKNLKTLMEISRQHPQLFGYSNNLETTHSKSNKTDDNEKY